MSKVIPTTQGEIEVFIRNLKSESEEELDVDFLKSIFLFTKHEGLRDIIAMKIGEKRVKDFLPLIIDTVIKNIDSDNISTLIYSASMYDCSEYIDIVTDIIILKNDMSFADASATYYDMNRIDIRKCDYNLKRLKLFSANLPRNDFRMPYVLSIIELLSSYIEH